MFTPLQHQEGFSTFSSFRNFNITINDTCEYYFVGYRGIHGHNHPCWLTALRVISFATIIIPIIFGLAFIISTLLLNQNANEKGMWSEKIRGENSRCLSKEKFAPLLSRSGISESPFDLVFALETRGIGGASFLDDGECSQYHEEIKTTENPSILLRYNYPKSLPRKIHCSTKPEADLNNERRVLTLFTTSRLNAASRVSNRIKEALILGFPSDWPQDLHGMALGD